MVVYFTYMTAVVDVIRSGFCCLFNGCFSGFVFVFVFIWLLSQKSEFWWWCDCWVLFVCNTRACLHL